MASRRLSALHPDLQLGAARLMNLADQNDLDLLIYCTFRSPTEQARLYRQGRTTARIKSMAGELAGRFGRMDLADLLLGVGPQYGPLRTYAAPGQSLHNYGYAFDAVPMRNGKPVWGTEDATDKWLWGLYGELVEEVGLEWAGRWERFREFPHAQLKGTDWRELISESEPQPPAA